MLSQYHDYARRNGVLPAPRGYDAQRQVAINGLRNQAGPGILVGILLVLTLLPFYLFDRIRSAESDRPDRPSRSH
jgi:hypothetical protein